MKRVETININGIIFSIDDDAYVKLCSYLKILGQKFENEQGGRDIIVDIEARVAELFSERVGGAVRVVTIADVSNVIETLGTPDDIAGDDSKAENENETATENAPPAQQTKKATRRLYRDTDQRYLGGVCAGIGAWAGINPVAIRLIFIFFAFFLFFPFFPFSKFFFFHHNAFPKLMPFLTYLILWIIIPKAKTTAQKLEMRGEPVNISNIEKNIRESFSDPQIRRSFRDFSDEAGDFLEKIFGLFGRIIGIIVGLFLLFWGIALTIGLICMLFMQDIVFRNVVEWDFLSFTELFRHIITPESFVILLICGITIAVLLVFSLLFWGLKLMSGFKIKHKLFHVTMAMLWSVAVITCITVCILQVRNFFWNNDPIVETRYIATHDTLYLSLAQSKMQISNNPMDIYFDKDNKSFYGKPNLSIQKSDDDQTRLKFTRNSQGENKRAAYQYAENIEYSVNVQDSLLIFDQFFTVIPQEKWKFQTLSITLYVPEGTVIVADNALCNNSRILGNWFRRRSNYTCTLTMTEYDGLQQR